MSDGLDLFGISQGVTAKQRELAQGQPRQARLRYIIKVTGVGETRLTGGKALDFGCFMLEEPTLSYGVIAIGKLDDGSLPIATACVTRWKVNDMGLFTGAEVGFRVESATYNVRLKFSLTFEAMAMRTTSGLKPT